MLSVENLTLKYGQSQILHGVSLTAEPGKVTAVTGTNGVGKTSLLKAIAGRHPYAGGTITLDCMSLIPFSPRRLMQTARDTDEADPIDEDAVVRALEGLATHLVNGLRPRVTTALAIQFCFRTSALRAMRVGMGAFRRLFELCERKCRECLVHPGDMVGTVAAQSIGEPATQVCHLPCPRLTARTSPFPHLSLPAPLPARASIDTNLFHACTVDDA